MPNQTYTGTEVGNRPVIVSATPPSIDDQRGDIESTRQTPSTSGAGAGVVVAGTVVTGTGVTGTGVTGTVVTGTVVAGAVVVPGAGEGVAATDEVGLDGAVVGVGTSELLGAVVGTAGVVVAGAVVTGEDGDVVVTGEVVGDGVGPTTDEVGPDTSEVDGPGVDGTGGDGAGVAGAEVVVGDVIGDVIGDVGTVVVVIPGAGAVAGGGGATRRYPTYAPPIAVPDASTNSVTTPYMPSGNAASRSNRHSPGATCVDASRVTVTRLPSAADTASVVVPSDRVSLAASPPTAYTEPASEVATLTRAPTTPAGSTAELTRMPTRPIVSGRITWAPSYTTWVDRAGAVPTAAATSSRGPHVNARAVETRRRRASRGVDTTPAASRSATAPATSGVAIDVPDANPYPPPGTLDRIDEPGAYTFTGLPKQLKLDRVSLLVVEPTVITPS